MTGYDVLTPQLSPRISEDDLAPISALQHMLYCPRQCALIHNEQRWAENRFTAEGRILHERTDSGGRERRGSLTIERSVRLHSLRLGVVGVADVVEIHGDGRLYPVEYKRGRPKAHRADEVQLCVQAMCLEEMLGVSVPEGALFYGQNRRRQTIAFDMKLRELSERVVRDTRRLLASGDTPDPEYAPQKCDRCSLKDQCQPQPARSRDVVHRWLDRAIND